ncbi:hypothetical protein M758_10G148100 [Ceratodon purpureus]|nr:hypothetical protein M758_10G148100 [Ceratodon purpureus]
MWLIMIFAINGADSSLFASTAAIMSSRVLQSHFCEFARSVVSFWFSYAPCCSACR